MLARAFNVYDYMLFQRLAFHSGNQIYGLIFNGLKKLYDRVGSYYFSNPQARELALNFYKDLLVICTGVNKDLKEELSGVIRQYGRESAMVWQSMKTDLPSSFTEDEH